MKINKRLAALFLSSAMIMSMTTGVCAATDAETVTPAAETNVLEFKNILHKDVNTNNPSANYIYSIKNADGDDTAIEPLVEPVTINTGSGVDTLDDANDPCVVSNGAFTLDVADLNITHAGEYKFKLVEKADPDNIVDELNDPTEYDVTVTVKNTEDGSISVNHVFVYNEAGEKTEPVFEEAYVDYSGEFTVSKNVVGEYADRSKDFTFSLTINKPTVSANVSENYVVTKYDKNGTGTVVTDYSSFTLKDGEYIKVTNVAIGSTYDVTETKDEDYDPSIALTEGGDKTAAGDKNVISEVKDGGADVLNGLNEADFTNTYNKDIPVTGVIMNNAPFIMLILAGAAAIVAFALLGYKRRH